MYRANVYRKLDKAGGIDCQLFWKMFKKIVSSEK